jgi:signal transduction histidine kinase
LIEATNNGKPFWEIIPHGSGDMAAWQLGPRAAASTPHESGHFAQFYETDEFLLKALSEFVATGLEAGDTAIVIATEAHRAMLEERLCEIGCDLAAVYASGQFACLDAAATLSRFMVAGRPEPQRFTKIFAEMLGQAARWRHVRVFGEMVALLWADGNRDAALTLEGLWNKLHKSHDFVLFCAYPMHGFDAEALARPLADICAEHTHVIPAESYTTLGSADDRLREIIRLQQKARLLEAEVAEHKRTAEALHGVKDELERQIEDLRLLHEAHEQLLIWEHRARAEAERANRMKDQFLTVAAHELRTPLTTLMGQAQLFERRAQREGHLSERDQRTLRVISDQVARLNKLVRALLDVSRFEMGQLRIERAPVDICALVRRVVREIGLTTEDRRIELVCPDESILIDGDELRLEQVVQNLIQNALKYSRAPDPIRVAITPEPDTGCIIVQDWGIGIPRDELPNLFKHFYRAKNAEAQHISGMGIGLCLVKEIITLHGGTVEVASGEGVGSTFSVRLPLAQQSTTT